MDPNPSQTHWLPEPEWDERACLYYFEGYTLSNGKPSQVVRYLQPHEIGPDGLPLQGLNPAGNPDEPRYVPSASNPAGDARGGQESVFGQPSGDPISYGDQTSYGDQSVVPPSNSSPQSPPNYMLGTGDQSGDYSRSVLNDGGDVFAPLAAFAPSANTGFSGQSDWHTTNAPSGSQSHEFGGNQWSSAAPFHMQGAGSAGQFAKPHGLVGAYPSSGGQLSHAAFSGLPGPSSGSGGRPKDWRSAGPSVQMSPLGMAKSALGETERIDRSKNARELMKSKRGKEFMKSKNGKEFLDVEKFKLHTSQSFRPGRIFKILWSEPKGAQHGKPTKVSNAVLLDEAKKDGFWTGFRRFIIIRNMEGHCTCVPIYSYGGQGCEKYGVKPEHHGIIYETGNQAILLAREPQLGFPPVRATTLSEMEPLSSSSRINYAKIVTVEHNVKVWFVGEVLADDFQILNDAVKKCFG